ncbi:hypothetical protein PR202_gb13984 [Eleusine coracana subsp. coracana]|uniref:phytol kinase n=1 Tax=Eleusine coracana subsp. coracana TaxID=191504 RepID=A0AAV5EU89_ELECO|nr:hypothetical protein PR202_gb13984 [Eleusine coracana subsp. coracana]
MAAAAWPVVRASSHSHSQCALLLSRFPTSTRFALAPAPGTSMRRRLLLGVGTPAVAALAAAVPPRCSRTERPPCSSPPEPTLLCAPSMFSPSGGSSNRQSLSRKIVHVLSGVLFMASWPLFSICNCINFAGFADIVGRRYGSLKLPFNTKKSWIGSISMFFSGFLLSTLMLFYFSSLGYIHVNSEEALGKLVLVALAATLVECIPVTDVVDDNISVPMATMLVAFMLFGSNAQ